MDGTFKLVKKPFYQLFSIRSFISKDGHIKQVPLAYALMSNKRAVDYERVIVAILDKLPDTIAVTKVVTDFEAAIWRGVRDTLYQVEIKRCVFHWRQAIWRHVQQLGFQVAYNENGTTYNYVRKLMTLPFLPEEQIIPVFNTLKEQATSHMQPLVHYVENTWILSTVFKPSDWCVFMQSIRQTMM